MRKHLHILSDAKAGMDEAPVRPSANPLAILVGVLAFVISISLFVLGYLFISVMS